MSERRTSGESCGPRLGLEGVLLALATLTTTSASAVEPLGGRGVAPAQSANLGNRSPRAVAVVDGQADFDIAVDPTGTPSLVVVSCLADRPGAFPLQATATPTLDRPRPLAPIPPPRFHSSSPLPPPPGIPAPAAPHPPPTERTFYLMTQSGLPTAAETYRPVPSQLRAVGQRVQVYVDHADLAAVDPAAVADIVATFDARIWPSVAERFGPAADVDGDGRFTVLLTGWLDRLADGRVQVDGFVRGADFDQHQPRPFGNAADLMFLNARLASGPHLRTVLAHEYTHAVTFSRKILDHATSPSGINPLDEEEGWLDEALAHLVEDELAFGRTNIDHRVNAYLSQPERYRLVVEDYYHADLFRSHGHRGATYLFLRWCVDQYGSTLLDSLIRSDLRGVANLEAATGLSFATLFRHWTLATFNAGLDAARSLPGDYRSIDLRGERSGFLMAGPRPSRLVAGGPAHQWISEGTAAHYLIVGRRTPGTVRVTVTGPADALLQITVRPLPGGLPQPELMVHPVVANDGTVRARVRLTEAGNSAVRLGALAWERLAPPTNPHSPGFRRGKLPVLAAQGAFGAATLSRGSPLDSAPILLAGVRADDGPLVFKLVGTDPQGRPVAAWATAPLVGSSPDQPAESIRN